MSLRKSLLLFAVGALMWALVKMAGALSVHLAQVPEPGTRFIEACIDTRDHHVTLTRLTTDGRSQVLLSALDGCSRIYAYDPAELFVGYALAEGSYQMFEFGFAGATFPVGSRMRPSEDHRQMFIGWADGEIRFY